LEVGNTIEGKLQHLNPLEDFSFDLEVQDDAAEQADNNEIEEVVLVLLFIQFLSLLSFFEETSEQIENDHHLDEKDEHTVLEIIGDLSFAHYSLLAGSPIDELSSRYPANLSLPLVSVDVHVAHKRDSIEVFAELDHQSRLIEAPL